MKKLHEQIAKIKGMMRMIQEGEYKPTISQEDWDARTIAMNVLADWVEGGDFEFYDEDITLSGGYFSIEDSEGQYSLYYSFDVKIISHAWYKPGNYENPPEGDTTHYNFINWKLQITNIIEDKVIYDGPDFTQFEDMSLSQTIKKMSNGSTYVQKYNVSDLLYDRFDEKINEMDNDRY